MKKLYFNNFKNITNRFNFVSQIKLTSKNNTILNFNSDECSKNWKLSKHWIYPKNIIYNKVDSKSNNINNDNATPKIITHKSLGNIKYIQYYRKMGKIISNKENVYINSGILDGKKVEIISSEEDSIVFLSDILKDKSNIDINSKDSISIIYLVKNELNVDPFIISSSEEKVILTNSKNKDAIIKAIQEL